LEFAPSAGWGVSSQLNRQDAKAPRRVGIR
jgi:hypothetical protein